MARWTSLIAAAAYLAAADATAVRRQNNSTSPYPGTDYPGAADPATDSGAQSYQTSPPSYPSPWGEGLGNWTAAYAKARAFVSQLTLLEKVNLTTGVGWEGEACVGNVGSIPRLGFKALCMQDSPLGIRFTDYNSAFPAGGTVAQSWDRDVWYQRGYAMAMEHRGKGIDVQLGPVVGPIGRSPEGGRNWEGFSPDPVLSGVAVAETIKGMQDAGVMACTKHLIANEQEHFRQAGEAQGYGYNISESISSNVDDVTMHELYLWPFADAVRAGTASVMCSYNQINNSYGCQNSYLLNHLLKRELGFQGFVMSDWQAQHAGVSTALAGLDMTMPGDTVFDSGKSYWGPNLTLAVVNGSIPEYRIDDMAVRIMAGYYLVGRDKTSVPVNFNSWTLDTYGYQHAYAQVGYGLVNQHVDVRDGHGGQIRQFAAKSNILLKNVNNALPLTGKEKFTAVIGEDADTNTYGPNGCADRGCDNGTLAMGWGSGTANFPYLVSPLTAIQNKVLENYGEIQSVTDNWAYSQIQSVAGQASVAMVFVNSDSGEGYISVDGNEGDRNNLTLWKNGETLIKTVTAECNNTIVVVHSVGPLLIDSWSNNPNITAIVWAGLPGEQSGNSLVDVLYGAVNPAGKLPFTLGATRESYGTDVLYIPNNGNDAPQDDFKEGVFIDYRHFDRAGLTPTYEFGFGLSYTTFSYSGLNIQPAANVPAYMPVSGMTPAAPSAANVSSNLADYQFPAGFTAIKGYIYPYLNSTNAANASEDANYGRPNSEWLPPHATDASPQPIPPAGGAPGGNPGLYDVLQTVTCTVKNTGKVAGDEVVQLYVSLGGPNDPIRVLRSFDRKPIAAGASATYTFQLTRRDLSNWDTVSQNWVITSYPKQVFVGASSRKLYLNGTLDMSNVGKTGMSSGSTATGKTSLSGTRPVSQISDGQVQAPTGRPISQISDGQVQAPTGRPVSQIGDGQVQAPTGKPISQISDGQLQAPKTTGKPVSQISDGQLQAPTTTGKPVSQISDGQVQAPTTKVSQMADGQPIYSTM